MRWAPDGAAYVPFIGDGDLAAELYADRRIYGADLDSDRIAVARNRLPTAELRIADCDTWTFPGLRASEARFAIADFDAYVDPYTGFRQFWRLAPKTDTMVLVFTDGRRQGFMRSGVWYKPDGSRVTLTRREKAEPFNHYLSKFIWPWFEDHVHPWRVVTQFRYLRGMMVYWGAVVSRARQPTHNSQTARSG